MSAATPEAPDAPEVEAPPQGRSIGTRAARGGVVVVGGQAFKIVLQVVSVAVLARLLTPEDNGLVAVVLLIVGFGEIFRDFGLSTAAVQAKELSVEQRNALWWVNTAIGLALTAIFALAAPLVAYAFPKMPHSDLTEVTRWLAVTFVLNGMAAQYRAHLNRQMRFTALVVSDVAGQFAGVAVAVVMAFAGAGYWALVAQPLFTSLATLVFGAFQCRWLPGRPRRGVPIRGFLTFGGELAASQLIGYLNANIATLVLGWRTSQAQVGYYNRGYNLLMRPLGQLRAPTTQVALPALSKLQDDEARSNEFLVRAQVALGYSLIAVSAFAAGAADPIVNLFLGDKWAPVVPVFALLAVAGACQTLAYVGMWVYLSRALTRQLLVYSVVTLVLKIVCVAVGSIWGVVGVAAGFAATYVVEWQLSLWWLSRITVYPARRLYVGGWRILATATVAAGAAYGMAVLSAGQPDAARLVYCLLAMLLAYAVLGLVVPIVRRDMRDLVRVARGAIRR